MNEAAIAPAPVPGDPARDARVPDGERAATRAHFPAGPRAWRLPALYRASIAVHAGAVAAVAAAPPLWPWGLAALAANHALIAGLSFVPRGQALGPALTRLPPAFARRGAVALTFDDGPDPDVTPWVLDALDRGGARATFFCVGERVHRHAALAADIVRRGHAVENHSYSHATTSGFWSAARWRRDVLAAQHAIADATGRAPRFFRPPFGVRAPLLEPALATLGLHAVTWSARAFDAVGREPERVLQRLLPQLAAGAIVVLHDGVAVGRRRAAGMLPTALPRVLDRLQGGGLSSVSLRALVD
jgi:peptidoglycan/xylan/chitin deacetylase (PgdA/CDA1 family)